MKPENIFLVVIAVFVVAMVGLFIFWTPLKSALRYLNVSQNNPPAGATSTAPAANDTERAATAYTQTRVRESGKYVTLVSYDGENFNPQVITIKKGENVRFVNKSNLTMRIVSNVFDGMPIYRGFNQAQSVGKGGTYELSIPDLGTWGYHNLNGNPGIIGIINVTN
jgi:plastocyanin